MNWISNVVRPRIRSLLSTKREVPENLWIQCPESGQMVFHKDLEANAFVVPGSDYHMRMSADDRLVYTFDDGEFELVPLPSVPVDPLKFRDGRRYTDRLKDAKSKASLEDAVLVAEGAIEGSHAVVAVQDFRFMGGSLGMAAGEAVITGMERAVASGTPFILFAASGGARMQEGILSLMQMPRTTIAVQRLRDAGLPYLVVLTDPTTGGVTASYAMLGDVHIAEPGALICFAGPRVIEQTIREQLPDGFQRAEYLLEHGMIDMVVHRHEMRATLARLCRVLAPASQASSLSPDQKDMKTSGHHAKDDETAASEDATSGGVNDAQSVANATSGVSDAESAEDGTADTSVESATSTDQSATEKEAPAKPEASMLGDLNILSTLGFAASKPAAKADEMPAADDAAAAVPDGNDKAAEAAKEASAEASTDTADAKPAKSDRTPPSE